MMPKRYRFLLILLIWSAISLGPYSVSAEEKVAEEEPFVYEDQSRRDPFWRLISSNGTIISYDKDLALTDLALEGIIVGDDNQNVAIINGTIVESGDTIGVYVIKQIRTNAVIVQKGAELYTLKLKKEE